MPNTVNIVKTMKKMGLPDDILAQFTCPEMKGFQRIETSLKFINKMDELLTPEQCLSIMEEQGCNKSERLAASYRAFGEKYADKTLEEKIALIPESDLLYKVPCRYNPDGTITIYFGGEEGNYRCACRKIKDLPEPADVSPTYCGCCAGHLRFSHQYALGVNLRLKEIVSSPISSGGTKRCEFLFEVVE